MSRRSEIIKRRIVRSLLSEWYGQQRAELESAAYASDTVKISDLAGKLLEKSATPEALAGIKLREYWTEIVGQQIATISEPISLIQGTAEIGVFHTAWIRELGGPVKKQIIIKINQILGGEFCNNIRFVPGIKSR